MSPSRTENACLKASMAEGPNAQLYRRAYQVGFMTSHIETALRALDRGETEWARQRLTEALAVAKGPWK